MEVNLKQAQTQCVKQYCLAQRVSHVPAARSSYAKDCEHTSAGRSPGSWL